MPLLSTLSPSRPLSSLLHLPTSLPFPTPSPLPSLRSRRPRPHLTLSSQNTPRPRTPTLFPGGYKRPEIKIPTVVLRVGSEEFRRDGGAAVGTAVRVGWVGIVVVSGDGGGGGGGRLLEVVRRVMEVVGGRAYVVVEERVDVAAAVGAAGVLLSDNGLPAIVARNMMSKSSSESVLLPLVGRTVLTAKQAVSASSTEGADFLVVETSAQNDGKMLEDFIGGVDVKIPIFFNIADVMGGDSGTSIMAKIPQFGASGVVLSLGDMEFFSNETFEKLFPNVRLNVRINHEANLNKDKDSEDHTEQKLTVAGFSRLQDETIQLIKEEKYVLHEAVTIIRKAAPMMEEVSLLVDAVSRLDQPFLLVIVGEFNTGKSTVINTLLGRRYLKEGVVPTTNEITLLCYPDRASVEQERCERHPDGQFICYLSAPLLKQMNLVDTPGTNVILQRQQRLTEEYVPRADLVIFVLSSDRPLTESEVAFLLYIQQWKKRVVFLLNKSDMYRNASELEEAMEFIKLNVRKLLNTEEVIIYPVSARSAIEAKLSLCLDTDGINEALLNDPRWRSSGFYELENFLFSFLDGSTDRGMERMRLKLETPILIGDRLLAACAQMVKEEYELAVENLASVNDLVNSVKDYMVKLENESISWKKQIMILVETTKNRVVKLTESILRLSNVDLAVTYAFRGENAISISAIPTVQNEIIDPALSDAQRLLEEYYQWLESSTSQESQRYVKSFVRKWPKFTRSEEQVHPEKLALVTKGEELSLKVTRNFSASAATKLFEQEIREVVLGTYGGLGVAGLSASLLTSVLPTTLEDLLALALCSTGGYIVISNFPGRRKIAIEKISRVADTLSQEIEEAMQEDLSKATENLTSFVELIGKPYKDAAQCQINRLSAIQCELNSVEEKLKELKTKIQNSHVS